VLFRDVQIGAVKQSHVAIERVHRPSPSRLAAEVIVPLNREAVKQHLIPVTVALLLDDLIPKLFDKPLVSDKPDRSLIAWH
jgi:hypothetical protein